MPQKGRLFVNTLRSIVKLLPLLFYMSLRMYGASFSAATPHVVDDTGVYTAMGSAPLFSKTLLAGLRPPLVPLVYKLFGNNFQAILLFQSAVSMAAWLFLAVEVSRRMHIRITRIASFLLINGIGMSDPVALWEGTLLSESLSISLSVLFFAAVLWFFRRQSKTRLIVVIAVTLLLMFSREANAWVLLVAAVSAAGVAVRKKWRRLAVWSAVVVVGFLVNNLTSTIGGRWVFPELNVLSQRILTSPERTAEFADCGMPVSAALMKMKGKWASSDGRAYYHDPALEEFRTWFFRYGKRTYICWLLRHPATAMREPLEHISRMVASGVQYFYGASVHVSLLPSGLSKLVFPIGYRNYFSLVLVWLLVGCTGISIGARAWRRNHLWFFFIALVLMTYPHLFIVWHADAMEVERHAMMARVQLNIAWWCMVLLFTEYCMERITAEMKLHRYQGDECLLPIRVVLRKIRRLTGE